MRESFLKTEKIYTISELNNIVRGLIRQEFPDYIWVCGEIQDYKASPSKKHIYFNLVQKHPEADQIIAQVKAIIFEDAKPKIFRRVRETESAFELRDDIEVKLQCRVDFYPKWGEYRLIVVDVDPFYTLGKVAANRQRIIEDLRRQNLLDKNKILPLPLVPLRIGLITSFGSAAYHDFINELKGSSYGFKIFIYDSYMQGKFVERDVVGALEFFNRLGDVIDIVVITRGGGSTADLGWFDNKGIAEAVAYSKFPVISALGHQINITITDLVAHTSLKTPTKVAQFLIDMVRTFLEQIEYFQDEITTQANSLIEKERQILQSLAVRFDSSVVKYFRAQHLYLAESRRDCLNRARALISSKYEKLLGDLKLLKIYLDNLFEKKQNSITSAQDKVKLLDPKNILRRGYSITFKDSRAVKDASELAKDDLIKTVFFKGHAFSSIKRIGEDDEKGD
jgi:exodeoxyribonuclease VII large subunit